MMFRPAALQLVILATLYWGAPTLRAGENVPNTLEQAFQHLDRQMSPAERESFKGLPERAAVTRAHRHLGMYIRNEWFRAGGSALPSLLRAQHLDDASSIILTSYWRHLNGKPVGLEAQITCYHRWWAEQHRLVEAAKSSGSSSHATPSFTCPEG
jgi:hypothetical protein